MAIFKSIKRLLGKKNNTEEHDDLYSEEDIDHSEESSDEFCEAGESDVENHAVDEDDYHTSQVAYYTSQLDGSKEYENAFDDPLYHEMLYFIKDNNTASERAISREFWDKRDHRIARILKALKDDGKVGEVDDPRIYDDYAYEKVLEFVKKTRVLSLVKIQEDLFLSENRVNETLWAMAAVGAIKEGRNGRWFILI